MVTAETKAKKIMHYYKLDGVRDLEPMKARGMFAKALMVEDAAGHTTPEAEELLDMAIAVVVD
jgi:hypothetical protein